MRDGMFSGAAYPVWGWHRFDLKPAKADLRLGKSLNFAKKLYFVTKELPANLVFPMR